MKPLRPQWSGLIFKLSLFYVLLSLPCLVLVESAILIFEFNRFMHGVEEGSLRRATQSAAAALGTEWPSAVADEQSGLTTWTQSWVLRLQRPHSGLVEEDSFVLNELTAEPLVAAILSPDGRVLAKAPQNADWKPTFPHPTGDGTISYSTLTELDGEESPYRIRRLVAPVRSGSNVRGYLFVELRLPVPWRRFLLDLSLEWPIVLGYLIVFGLASSFFLAAWVTRRLNRVARAASAWSRGDFTNRIDDRSSDELGRLSELLDRMALEFKDLMRSRSQLAAVAERQRLARDLHDTVKQKAFALSLQLAAIRRQLAAHPAAESIAQTERLAQQIQQDLVMILDELRTDTGLPFAVRLRTRAIEWSQVSGVHLNLQIVETATSDAETEEALLRITDEALANVLRHSGATTATINFREDKRRCRLCIEDDGRGVPSEASSGMGLSNMRQRAEALTQGCFEFESGAGGTRVVVSFAVPETRPT